MVILNRGAEHGVREGDRVVLHDDRRLVAAGEIVYVTDSKSGVSIRQMPEGLPDPCDATIIPIALEWPTGAYRVARVESVLPSRGLMWMDGGSRDGWRVGDAVLVYHSRAAFSFGTVVEVGERAALIEAPPPGGAAGARPGSVVEQIGAMGGAIRTRVTEVGEGDDSRVVRLAGGAALSIREDDRIDFFRDGDYAGFGRMTPDLPSITAAWVDAFSPHAPQPGDEALVRSRASDCAAGYVFRVEGDYCLVSIGQNDGLELGETLVSESGGVELSVQTLYPDHCGASLTSVSPGASLRLWMSIRRNKQTCGTGGIARVGSQPTPHAPWLVEIAGPPGAQAGDWVCLSADGTLAILSNEIRGRVYAVRVDQARQLPTATRPRNN